MFYNARCVWAVAKRSVAIRSPFDFGQWPIRNVSVCARVEFKIKVMSEREYFDFVHWCKKHHYINLTEFRISEMIYCYLKSKDSLPNGEASSVSENEQRENNYSCMNLAPCKHYAEYFPKCGDCVYLNKE